jgi:RNase P/RNase MRP subunit p29
MSKSIQLETQNAVSIKTTDGIAKISNSFTVLNIIINHIQVSGNTIMYYSI